MYHIVDFRSKEIVQPNGFVFTGENSQPWEVIVDLDKVTEKLSIDYFKTLPASLSKYLPMLPIRNASQFISLQEVATPLVKSKYLGKILGIDLYFKIEGKNTTGSFKDRGSAVEIAIAKELNAKAIILASTGNMAASCACYAAVAGIPCFILVPEGVPINKIAQVIAFGGKVVQIKGTYNDAAVLAEKIAKDMDFYLAGDYAFRVEGQKTAAFEVCDQLLFQAPDLVLIPIGCGTNMAAYAKGFDEYFRLKLIDKKPKLYGIQAEGAAAVVKSFNAKIDNIEPLAQTNTLASAISVPNPIDGIKALDAINSSGGGAIEVTDQEILEAQHLLSVREGIFVESSSASTIAALLKGSIPREAMMHRTIVCVLTGDGLKDAGVILKAAVKPPTIHPDIQEFNHLLKSNFFHNKTMIFADKEDIIFDTIPTVAEIENRAKTLLNAKYDSTSVLKIKEILTKILSKGKKITIADFQDSIEYATERKDDEIVKHFFVLDFKIVANKDKEAFAEVKVKIDDEEFLAKAVGVGPVDAVLNALCSTCNKIDFKLLDYKVDIRGQGKDAVVYVELKLSQNHKYSMGHAASPDIIQASIEAFEVAYNNFIV